MLAYLLHFRPKRSDSPHVTVPLYLALHLLLIYILLDVHVILGSRFYSDRACVYALVPARYTFLHCEPRILFRPHIEFDDPIVQ